MEQVQCDFKLFGAKKKYQPPAPDIRSAESGQFGSRGSLQVGVVCPLWLF
jgi:hypothetical protein